MDASALVDTLVSAVEEIEISLLVDRVLLFRRHIFEDGVECDPEHVMEHLREQVAHPLVQVGHLWIRVDFDEPDAEVLVDHEVEPEKFVGVLPLARVERGPTRHIAIDGNVLHPGDEVFLDLQFVLWVLVVQVLLKLLEADDVAFLVHAVCVLVLDLKTIVRQVNILIVLVDLSCVLLAARAQVANVVEVEFVVAVGEAPHSDVELSILEEQGLLDVLLDDPVRELQARFEKSDDLIEIIKDLDALALVLVRWLDQPYVLSAVFLR